MQLPQLTVRLFPQLSALVTLPQFLARREQNAPSVSGVQDAPDALKLLMLKPAASMTSL